MGQEAPPSDGMILGLQGAGEYLFMATNSRLRLGQNMSICPYTSDVNLLGNRKSVIDLNTKIPDGTFDLGVP